MAAEIGHVADLTKGEDAGKAYERTLARLKVIQVRLASADFNNWT